MSSSISAASAKDLTNTLFAKLDTQKKGYIDAADLKTAAGANANDSKVAEVFAKLDGDSDGRVTKSELSVAIEKVGNELSAQANKSRVDGAKGGARHAGGPPPGGGGGPPPAKAAASDADTAPKYVAAADTDGDGTVSDAEEAAYKQLLANAEAKAQAQAGEYQKVGSEDQAAPSAVNVSA